MTRGILVLQDGTTLEGAGFGAEKECQGEVVFATAMAGYQESLTDPSYKYQILMPTYPLIGNYGITPERFESDKVQVEGFVVREMCEKPSHGRMTKTLDNWLKEENIPGLQGVDTRFLTRKIRNFGVMNGIMSSSYDPKEIDSLKSKAEKMKSISEIDLIEKVTVKKTVVHKPDNSIGKRIVLLDCGAKISIVKSLVERGVEVIQVPASTKTKEILAYEPDGMMVSNGPGDPDRATKIVKNIKGVIDSQLPTFGICFGNQLVGKALGGSCYKLKFGHRGGNQPVKELATKRVHVTSQNHGFALDGDSLPSDIDVTHINLNDKSVEGIAHKSLPVYTVQYHPEAHPGPWDSEYLFDEFIAMM
jgi:carbamoyl-phosphate synthase small subunit